MHKLIENLTYIATILFILSPVILVVGWIIFKYITFCLSAGFTGLFLIFLAIVVVSAVVGNNRHHLPTI